MSLAGFTTYEYLAGALAVSTTTIILAGGGNVNGVVIGSRSMVAQAGSGSDCLLKFLFGALGIETVKAKTGFFTPSNFASQQFLFLPAGNAIQWRLECAAACNQDISMTYKVL